MLCIRLSPSSSLFPYTTLFRSPEFHGLRRGKPKPTLVGFCKIRFERVHDLAEITLTSWLDKHMEVVVEENVSKYCKWMQRSEEHTSELQSPCNLVCRLLLETKK